MEKNNAWNIRCLVDESFDLVTQRIILNIVGFQKQWVEIHYEVVHGVSYWNVQSKLALKYWRKLIPKYLCFSINIANFKKNHIISRIYPFNEKCCIYSPWYNLSKSKIKSSVQFCKRESSSSLVSTGLAKLVLIVNLDCMSR